MRHLRAIIVRGIPRPQGSKQPRVTKSGKLYVKESSEYVGGWREDVAAEARRVMERTGEIEGTELAPLTGPISASFAFTFPRLKSHYNTKGELKPDAPFYKTSAPDLSKLIRAVEDALIGVVYKDDAQLVKFHHTEKVYGDIPGVVITLVEGD